MDVKDILGVSRSASAVAERVEKVKEKKLVKPKGMSREAFALLSASHPLHPSHLAGDLRKEAALKATREKTKRSSRGRAVFQWRPFANPGRADGLQLKHWVKCFQDAAGKVAPADPGEYSFAKYNKKVVVLRYDDEEWTSLITKQEGWSREETDHLLDVVQALDLRWLVIADRYEFEGGARRSMEDLKERYYAVQRDLLVGRAGGPEPVAHEPLVRHPYNRQHEQERKKGLELLLDRTKEQEEAESRVLAEAAAIESARKEEEAARRASAEHGGSPGPGGLGVPPVFDESGKPAVPPKRAIVRGAFCRELAEGVAARLQPAKVQKALEGSMAELKVTEFPRAPTRAACGAYISLQAEVLALLELKRQLATNQALAAGNKRPAARMEGGDDGTPRSDKRQRVARKFADD
ncbi:DNA methyltransferase 1-associated protein 1 [Auxenochlorella protothecoides]|uniref:DNA methyltransferase 1-associated protein 1 n=1 Tax=Auxenochlorella protothecoides TaxID=3075 RepID=A0A087SH34_AUXPR|nr:DNA methyltransferase 1-associated protein 1 [Auxenochlorella protothecoides]KFM25038.1 DNA methyltransferase 1-associated protein 1 [Auxenochlorella protothecoides]